MDTYTHMDLSVFAADCSCNQYKYIYWYVVEGPRTLIALLNSYRTEIELANETFVR